MDSAKSFSGAVVTLKHYHGFGESANTDDVQRRMTEYGKKDTVSFHQN